MVSSITLVAEGQDVTEPGLEERLVGLKSGKQRPPSCQFQKAQAIRNGGMYGHHSEAVINIPAARLVEIADRQLST